MRGSKEDKADLFSYVSLDERVPKKHPLRKIKTIVDSALAELDGEFDELYSEVGRPSIPPEHLIRGSLLQILYSIRSERQLMEQLDYNLLFRWFVGLSVDEKVWNATTYSKNRDRLVDADISRALFEQIIGQAKRKHLVSSEHFSVDGTLIAAWASQKSVRRRDGSDDDNPDGTGRNASRSFHKEKRSNSTHLSRTDPEALLAKKGGNGARPSFAGHIITENREGLVVDAELTQATGKAEREAAVEMAARLKDGATLGADKNYDTADFVDDLRTMKVVPHVAQNLNRPGGSAIDRRTTRHAGYAQSQKHRKRVEEPFGWGKEIGPIRQTKFRGVARVGFQFLMTMTGWNLVRMCTLADW